MPRLVLLSLFIALSAFAAGENSSAKSEAGYFGSGQRIVDTYPSVDIQIENHWSSDVRNGFADRRGGQWIIETHGGLYRSDLITDDGYMAFLCHELGHHVGGAPFKPDILWMSQEGQADYFAASECLKKLWTNEDNLAIISRLPIPEALAQQCGDSALCKRIGLAGFSFVEFNRVEHGFSSETSPVRFDLRSSDIVTRYLAYPRAQCRLDTFMAGAAGLPRPRCWYIP